MASSDMVLGSVEGSNLPSHEKSKIRNWVEKVSGGLSKHRSQAMGHVNQIAQVARGGGEALLTGGALGFLHAEMKTGLDMGEEKIPLDGIVAVVGLGGAIMAGGHETATDLRNTGQTALGILSFRKTHDWIAEKKIQKGEVPGSSNVSASSPKVHGDGEDIGADGTGGGSAIMTVAATL